MQTNLSEPYRQSAQGQTAEAILRACVHCGFCTATCPTYQLLGDELDGPRGRIYQIKQILEGAQPTAVTRTHLDRCLSCRSCETTCPSGVDYGRLLDIGREIVEEHTQRPFLEKLQRQALRTILPYPQRVSALLAFAYLVKPLLPKTLARKLPAQQGNRYQWSVKPQARKVLAFEGCVQAAVTPSTTAALARILHQLGIELVRVKAAGCCGAVSQHLAAPEAALNFMRRNIDAWWPHLEAGAEAIVISASGCGLMLKEYGHLLKHDPLYATKAQTISALAKDSSELLATAEFSHPQIPEHLKKVAFHSPCTLQHGLKLNGVVEGILQKLGFELVPVADAHLCCGSAGTYSILQAELSQQLLSNKLQALQASQPQVIATANIGCQLHLASGTKLRVVHWLELVDQALADEYPLNNGSDQ
ncbi:glycolate oxidase iron-sulfur subunit [Thiothrix eikelboomii]|uniref:Glycolate oxidase iron-sulfur subunit n=1 Tax=Thiothrix eikelboomii TaxID=92487 RepID=A0A1T4XNL5_9GAMM|nr:glycolate oxidase subunit GlcF [Thiothrix eikelboomii]SKA91139.1 glycolate oxidase iron-sulfur subunit [Thiothrix eikelboomii]